MKALQFDRPRAMSVVEVPEPKAPGPSEALVRVHGVGICGTDYAGYLGKMPFFSYPRIPGHELGVEVMAIGESVTNVKRGDRCSVEPYINCQTCYACLRGHSNCCENNQTLGVHCDGGMRPLYVLPARKLHPAPSLTFAQCALVETLAIGCHAVDRGQTKPSDTVLVVGAGPIGLSVIEFAKLAGARVIVADMNERRLAFTRQTMGVAHTVLTAGDGSEISKLRDMTNGRFCDVVFDATGSHQSMSYSMHYCAFAGRLVYVGITQADLTFPHAPILHRRELTIAASRNALPKDFTRIIGLVSTGKIDTRPWITHQTHFDNVLTEFPKWLKPETGVIKAVVEI